MKIGKRRSGAENSHLDVDGDGVTREYFPSPINKSSSIKLIAKLIIILEISPRVNLFATILLVGFVHAANTAPDYR